MASVWLSGSIDYVRGQNCSAGVGPRPCQTEAEFIGYNLICSCLCIVGTLCNVLNLLVFQQARFRVSGSTRLYLRGLASADLLASVVHLTAVLTICQPSTPHLYQLAYHNYVTTPVVNYFINVDIWLTMAISADR